MRSETHLPAIAPSLCCKIQILAVGRNTGLGHWLSGRSNHRFGAIGDPGRDMDSNAPADARRIRWSATAGTIAPIWFWVTLTTLALLHGTIDVSGHQVLRYGFLMYVGFFAYGSLTLVFAWGLRRRLPSRRRSGSSSTRRSRTPSTSSPARARGSRARERTATCLGWVAGYARVSSLRRGGGVAAAASNAKKAPAGARVREKRPRKG